MDPLIIIPARAGSCGIPGKNTRTLAGISPLERAIVCAQALRPATLIVTTDITCWAYRGDPSFLPVHYHVRPKSLATDTASMADVVADVLQAFPGPDAQPILLVQPTQPLRMPWHLQRALNLLHTYERVASVVEVESAQKLYYAQFVPVAGSAVERRQDGKRTYRCDGTVYGFHRGPFCADPRFITRDAHMMILDPAESCPLDTELDWHLAELRLQDTLRHDPD